MLLTLSDPITSQNVLIISLRTTNHYRYSRKSYPNFFGYLPTTTNNYDTNGNIVEVEDARGNSVKTKYSNRGINYILLDLTHWFLTRWFSFLTNFSLWQRKV